MSASCFCFAFRSATGAVALLLSLYASAPAWAVEELAEVVVTGTRSDRSLLDTPVRTEVVSAQEIERTHARSLTEALENVPGLQLREIRGKSGYELSLQGLSSDQVLVLIDGLPLAASTGSTVDLSQYALAEVERIEVVKGAASAQYGSAALGGVINVITRDIAPGFSGRVSADAGSYGEQNVSADATAVGASHGQLSLEGGSERIRVRLAADVRDDKGFAVDPQAWARQGDAAQRGQFGGRLDVLPDTQSRYWLEASRYSEDDEQRLPAMFFPPNYIYPSKTENITRDRYIAGLQQTYANDLRVQLKALHESYDSLSWKTNNLSSTAYESRDARQDTNHVSAQLDLPAWSVQLWQLGVDWHQETLQQSLDGVSEFVSSDGVERSSKEVFAQDDIFLRDNLELLLGLRYQDDSDFGGHAAPKLSLRWSFLENVDWNGALRLSAGNGYRVPNLKERYYLFDHSSLGYKVQGNPELKPESSDSYQAGLAFNREQALSFDINVFYNDVKDMIQIDESTVTTVGGIAIYSYGNVAHARTMGAETGLRWQALPSLGVNASYTYTHSEDVNTGSALTRRPAHMARLGMDWAALEKTTLTLRARYQGEELAGTSSTAMSPAWTVFDCSLNQKIAGGITAFAGVNNMFATQRDFSNPADFGPITGRYVYLGATWAWDINTP